MSQRIQIQVVEGGSPTLRPDAYMDNDLSLVIYSQLGPRMLKDRDLCVAVWEALTNTIWIGRGQAFGYTFRAAGDLIASILDIGTYNDWEHCGSPGFLASSVIEPLRKSGWTYQQVDWRETHVII